MAGIMRKRSEREGQGRVELPGVGSDPVETLEMVASGEGQREPLLRPQAAQVLRGETVRLTLAVPRPLHTRLKLAAVRQERSIVSLVSAWIEEQTVLA